MKINSLRQAHSFMTQLVMIVVLVVSAASIPRVQAQLANGLQGYWKFNGDGVDASKNGRDLNVNAGFASGLLGKALNLPNNNGQYAIRPGVDNAFEFGSGDFTVQVWVNWNSTSGIYSMIAKFSGSTGPGWTFIMGQSIIQFYWGNDRWLNAYPGDISVGVWHQFVARRLGDFVSIFFDGSFMSIHYIDNILASPNPLILGKRRENGIFPVDGRIDEVAIWNRGLTDAEIAQLYNKGAGLDIPLGGPIISITDTNGNSLTKLSFLDQFLDPNQNGHYSKAVLIGNQGDANLSITGMGISENDADGNPIAVKDFHFFVPQQGEDPAPIDFATITIPADGNPVFVGVQFWPNDALSNKTATLEIDSNDLSTTSDGKSYITLEGLACPLGVDVSEDNTVTSWVDVHNDGRQFAFIRATLGAAGVGSKWIDNNFIADMTDAKAAGLEVGAYHIAYPKDNGDTSEAVAEANNFLSQALSYIGTGYLPPVLDIESDKLGTVNTRQKLSPWVRTWLQTVRCSTGVTPILYVDRSTLMDLLDPDLSGGTYGLWITTNDQNPTGVPNYLETVSWPYWQFKQYQKEVQNGCAGINGKVDLDSFHGTLANLVALTIPPANNPPVFAAYPLIVSFESPTTISIEKMLTHSTDPDGDPVNLDFVSSTSEQGGNIAFDASGITYSPPSGFIGEDGFTVTITDCRGATATGLVKVVVLLGSVQLRPSIPGPGWITSVGFYGIPTQSYDIQRSTDLANWSKVATINASSTGQVQYSETTAAPQAFYRMVPTP